MLIRSFACQRVIVMECLMCTHVVSNDLEIFEFSRVQPESDTQCSQLGKAIIRSDRKRCGPLLVYVRLVPKCWFQPVWSTFDDCCAVERRKGKKDLWPTGYPLAETKWIGSCRCCFPFACQIRSNNQPAPIVAEHVWWLKTLYPPCCFILMSILLDHIKLYQVISTWSGGTPTVAPAD